MHKLWAKSDGFPAFFEHIGARPGPGYSLDRRDNTKGYVPGNVRWATREEQMRNTSRNVWVTDPIDGERMIAMDFARKHGVENNTVLYRAKHQLPLLGPVPMGGATHKRN